MVRRLLDKQCTSNPLPTWLLKQSVEVLAPFLCQTFNWSLENGTVPSISKSAYITPLLKKADLDPAEPKSFRPISNQSVMSKLLEPLVSKQLLRYLKDSDLLPDLQSAYRAHHSTETAILRVLSDILSALDSGNLVMLIADSAQPVSGIRLRRPSHAASAVAQVVRPWREGRQLVYVVPQRPNTTSPHSDVQFDAIGSRFWSPARFGPWTDLISPLHCRPVAARKSHHLTPHAYGNDTHIYGHCQPSDAGGLAQRVTVCIGEISVRMKANRLQLNLAKTKVLWCTSSRRRHLVPTASVCVGRTTDF